MADDNVLARAFLLEHAKRETHVWALREVPYYLYRVSATDYLLFECIIDPATGCQDEQDIAHVSNERELLNLLKILKANEAVKRLISESTGVVGLHLNGDVAPWDELLSNYLEDLDV